MTEPLPERDTTGGAINLGHGSQAEKSLSIEWYSFQDCGGLQSDYSQFPIEEGDEGEFSDDSDDIGFGLGAKPAVKKNTTSTFGNYFFCGS